MLSMVELLFTVMVIFVMLAFMWVAVRLNALAKGQHEVPALLEHQLEEKHRTMLTELLMGLTKQGDRLASLQTEASDRQRQALLEELRNTREDMKQGVQAMRSNIAEVLQEIRTAVHSELDDTRRSMHDLQQFQSDNLSSTRESLMQHLAELSTDLQQRQDNLRHDLLSNTLQTLNNEGRANQQLLQDTLHAINKQMHDGIQTLTQATDYRLEQISGVVNERLAEGFKKTNATFDTVLARLATIDDAQKKMDQLTGTVVNLQDLLSDKRARGAFGEVQLADLLHNVLPPTQFTLHTRLPNGELADAVLHLPEPTGNIAIDAKLPLDHYHRMTQVGLTDTERLVAQKQFRHDVRKHLDHVAARLLVTGATADSALVFVPAEAVFAEIHARHPELVSQSQQKRVWLVSPTTMMAVLNTARAVLRDADMRRQVQIIQQAVGQLGRDFTHFDQRMQQLAENIRQAHEDATAVHSTSRQLSQRFAQIGEIELAAQALALPVITVESAPQAAAGMVNEPANDVLTSTVTSTSAPSASDETALSVAAFTPPAPFEASATHEVNAVENVETAAEVPFAPEFPLDDLLSDIGNAQNGAMV